MTEQSHPLAAEWRTRAASLTAWGAAGVACGWELAAHELEADEQARDLEGLTLTEAAEESGYTRDHLSRLISDGVIPNAGKKRAPRISLRDLPRKPGHRRRTRPGERNLADEFLKPRE